MKQRRCTSANVVQSFRTSEAFFRHMAGQLAACCDGRGCTICIAADALEESAKLCELRANALAKKT